MRTTILVTLFSASPDTTSALNTLLDSIQTGYDAVTAVSPPEIHCLYCKEGEAFQFQLVQHSHVRPVPSGSPSANEIALHDMDVQLSHFFASSSVATAVSNGDPVYLIIGAHGKPPGPTLGGIFNQLRRLLVNLLSFVWQPCGYWIRVSESWHSLFDESLPVGAAFATARTSGPQFISLTDLNCLLKRGLSDRPFKAVVLHSCWLSSVETAREIDHTEQQVACESRLAANLDLNTWIPVAGRGEILQPLSGVISPAQGIFSSHDIYKTGIDNLIACLNELGKDLHGRIAGLKTQIETARHQSRVDSSEMVDVWSLCVRLNGICSPSVLSNLQGSMTTLQREYQEVPPPGGPPEFHFHGISVFFPTCYRPANVSNLPSNFLAHAHDWVAFLTAWVP